MANIDLTSITAGSGGFVINGEAANDYSGISVSSIGDVNGDGLDDLIVGAYLHSSSTNYSHEGRSYVVFGKGNGNAIDLSAVAAGNGGFAINGEGAGDRSGWSVYAAGDVNGDGLADLIVGAPKSNPNGFDSGRSYVVFGKNDGNAIDLSSVTTGDGGFVINGEMMNDQSGFSVSAAGDVNGDGLADLIVGAPYSDHNGSDSGRSYVVFGKSDDSAINLSAVAAGSGGFAINGGAAGDQNGHSVSSAGDVNGDGLADLIVGSNDADGSSSGSYVVFGKRDGSAINLSAITAGNGGFAINGEASGDLSGSSVSAAGDVNGDGLADLIVGAKAANGIIGRSYVVFGKIDASAINLAEVGNGIDGFAINGETEGDFSGVSVAAAGDINGDGLADLIVGADGYYAQTGRSYVVFGKSDGSVINLADVSSGIGGFAINGEEWQDYSGNCVAAAGDVNGDGLADLIIGAWGSDPNGSKSGRSYIIFGSTSGAFADTAVDHMGTEDADTLTDEASADHTLIGGAGNDSITGNGGADVIYAGAGDDVILVTADNITQLAASFTAGNYARLDGGGGIDTLKLDGGDITLDLTAIANQGGAAPTSSSRIESIEKIDLGGSGDNSLILSEKDVIDMTGFNLFNDGDGWSGLGAIVNKHQLVVDGNHGDSVNLADWSFAGIASNGGQSYSVFNTANAAQLLVNNAMLYASIVDAADLLANSKDKLSGTADDDLINGGAGADSLTGNAGNDLLNGGTGADSLKGGAGDDSYIVDDKGDKVTETGNQGTDQVLASISYKLGKNVENLTLTGSDNLNASGNELANQLIGNSGDNILDGGKGVDRYRGGGGNDTYLLDNLLETDIVEISGQGTDTIQLKVDKLAKGQISASYTLADNVENLIITGKAQINLIGNASDNSLTGNAKANQLTGGAGADSFVFNAAPSKTNIDTITDFETGVDKIALDDKIFKKLLGVTNFKDNFEDITSGSTASDNSHYLLYETDTGNLYYDADGAGKKPMVLIGVFVDGTGHHPLVAASDFVVV
jgi:Ca2+-binding RTX toxin-like protein